MTWDRFEIGSWEANLFDLGGCMSRGHGWRRGQRLADLALLTSDRNRGGGHENPLCAHRQLVVLSLSGDADVSGIEFANHDPE